MMEEINLIRKILETENSSERPSFKQIYLSIATIVSLRSTCLRTKVGACMVKDNRIVSIGYSGNPSGLKHCSDKSESDFICYKVINNISRGSGEEFCTGLHAEANCILNSSTQDRIGAVLYSTHFPCSSCAKLIVQSKISEVHYIHEYPDFISSKMFEKASIRLYKY
jgi:dCMP deaminase